MTRKILNTTAFVTLIVASISLLTVWVWVLYPYKPIVFTKVTTVKNAYKPGDTLTIDICYCKYTALPATYISQFINGMVFTMDTKEANAPKGCGTIRSIDIVIPTELLPGEYSYRQTMIYQVNPIRRVDVVFQTNKFIIIE